MKKILELINDFERNVTLLFFNIEKFLYPNREKFKIVDQKVNQRVDHYNWLIQQYYLIAEKKSALSAKERQSVIDSVNFLVSKGHITGTLPEIEPKKNESTLKVV